MKINAINIAIGLLILLAMFVFVWGIINIMTNTQDIKEVQETLDQEDPVYQGPVRPDMDEEHFRRTGESIPKK